MNGGGPSQAKGGTRVLKSHSGIEDMSFAKGRMLVNGLQSLWKPTMKKTATHYPAQ